MDKPPTPGKVVKEKTIDKIGVTEWTLSNGVRVIVKPTDYELDTVVISGSRPGGEAMASDKLFPDARFADNVAGLGGVASFDADTLKKVLAGKKVDVETGFGGTTDEIDGGGSSHDLETMLQLVYLKVTQPRKDEQQFAVWQTNSAEQLANRLRTPELQFARQSQVALYKNNLRRRPVDPDELKKIDLGRAFDFYKDRFADVNGFTFVIVGAVDLAKLKPLVETYLASLPSHGRKDKEKDLGIRKVAGVVKQEWKLGEAPKATVQLDFHGDESWSRDKDRDMFILGQVLSIKLREVMREDMSGVYGVGAHGSIARSPHQERSFVIQFGCDPKRVDELIGAAFTEIGKIQKDGIGQDYLDKVKETFLRERETQLRNNRFWAGWLATSYRYGDDPTIILDTAPFVARMTSDNVKAAAKKYLDAKQYFQAVRVPAVTK